MRSVTVLLLSAASVLLAGCGGATASPSATPAPASDAAGILRQCQALRAPDDSRCYETALHAILRDQGVRAAMQRLEELGELSPAVRREGHAYAHAIGLAAYTSAAEVGRTYAECTPSFQSGCYHGVIQSYFVEHAAQHGPEHLDAATVNALCADYRDDPAERWQLFQCVHGAGHGLTMVFDYHLPRTLQGCDLLASDWEREGCYGGAFMENIVQATAPHHGVGRPHHGEPAAADPGDGHGDHGEGHGDHAGAAPAEAFKPLDPAEPLYPCTVLEARYLNACYNMQTSAILFFNQGDMAAAFRACDGAPEAYREACYQSLGRDISSYTQQNHAEAVRLCSLGDPRYRPLCHVGYAKNLVDLTARADDGFAYCATVPDGESKRRCYQGIGEEIWVLAGDTERREALCGRVEPAFREACRSGAALPPPQE